MIAAVFIVSLCKKLENRRGLKGDPFVLRNNYGIIQISVLKSAAVLNKERFPNVFLRLTGAGRGALIEVLGLTCVSVSLATHSYTDCGVYAVFVNVQLVNKRSLSNLKVRV